MPPTPNREEEIRNGGFYSMPAGEILMQTGQIVTHEMIERLQKHFEETQQKTLHTIKERVEGMIIPCIGNPEMMQPLEERIRNETLKTVLQLLEEVDTNK